jgi:hypothetical protein
VNVRPNGPSIEAETIVWPSATSGHALRTAHRLVQAGVFDDLLDQAGHLLVGGYYLPAASLVGAVLEATMRSSAPRMGVRVSPGDDLSALNQKFAQADVYTVIRRKQIEVGAGIRNNVDHGHFDQVTTADVEEMLASVQQFLGAELA